MKLNFELLKKINSAREWLKNNNYYEEFIANDYYSIMNEYEFAKKKGYKK